MTTGKHVRNECRGSKGPADHSSIAYRPDIDGLRALAVLPVVAFHLNIPLLRGGFVGVDVFFVISGYLITGILLHDFAGLERGWLGRFYLRRMRRILPALLATITLTLAVGVWLLFADELVLLGKNVLAALFFASNLILYAQTNYFAAGSEVNPVLHLWSLAVEEQFYLFYPPLLYLMFRFWRGKLPLVLLALAVASFVLCLRVTETSPQAAFYLPIYRVWELAAGGLLAVLPGLQVRKRLAGELLSIAGIALIIGASCLYYKKMIYPGVWALAPVLGAVFLVVTGKARKTLASRLLSTAPAVYVGRISYSLYLVHWPLFVFVHLVLGRALQGTEQAVLFFASIALSHVSWRFIEQPFRLAPASKIRQLAGGLAGATAGLAVVSALLVLTGGVPQRFAPEVEKLAHYANYDDVPVYRRGSCFIDAYQHGLDNLAADPCLMREPGQRNVLLIGDSHAAHLWKALEAELPGVHVMQATASGCKPFLVDIGLPGCMAIMSRALRDELPKGGFDGVIVAGEWKPVDLPYLAQTLGYVKRFTPNVYLVGPIVEYNQSLARLLARSTAWHLAPPGPEALIGDGAPLDTAFERFARSAGVTYLSTYRALCATPQTCLQEIAGVPVQWDNSHLTAEGAVHIVAVLKSRGAFQAILR